MYPVVIDLFHVRQLSFLIIFSNFSIFFFKIQILHKLLIQISEDLTITIKFSNPLVHSLVIL